MKRAKDGRKVMMGKITMNTHSGSENRLQLFDGKFTSGWRVVEFRIIPKSPQNQEEVMAVISTEAPGAVPSTFDFTDVQNIAYAAWNVPNQVAFADWNLVVEENMAVEDLWVSCYTTGDDDYLNYYLVLEKYNFEAWDGAGIMARNNGQ